MKSFVALAILLASAVAAQHHAPLGMRNHRRTFNNDALERREEMNYRRAPLPQRSNPLDINIPGPDPTESESSSVSQSTSTTSESTSSSTTPRQQDPTPDPPSSSSTTTSTSTTTTPSQTSTTSMSTSTSASSTSTSAGGGLNVVSRTSQDSYAGISYTPGRSASVRTSTSGSSEETGATSDSSTGGDFASNKAAVAATATVAALVALGALVFIAFWWKKKSKRNDLNEDMWDGASMKEFSDPTLGVGHRGSISAPPPAMRNVDLESEMGMGGGALARSNTKVLPSQQQAVALARSRSTLQRENVYEEEPDVLLAMPPVAHYERPRDSAYDIVPAAPPAAAGPSGGAYGYSNAYASGSGSAGGLQPPSRKGDHTSFGSGLGNDPFAGTGFVDASRESTFGPGQAGRGAGYGAGAQVGGHQPMMDQGQWSQQQYNPYTGYSQHSPQGYGGGYGYAS